VPVKKTIAITILAAVAILSYCAQACPEFNRQAPPCPAHHQSDCCDAHSAVPDFAGAVVAVVFDLPLENGILSAPMVATISESFSEPHKAFAILRI
jgi:hypothetical protein